MTEKIVDWDVKPQHKQLTLEKETEKNSHSLNVASDFGKSLAKEEVSLAGKYLKLKSTLKLLNKLN